MYYFYELKNIIFIYNNSCLVFEIYINFYLYIYIYQTLISFFNINQEK